MEIAAEDLGRIPRANLRVDAVQFADLWVVAEAHQESAKCDAFTAGVVDTCRWLAQAVIRPDAPWFAAPAPVTAGRGAAIPERIAAEYGAAELEWARLLREGARSPERERIAGVVSTLRWAWSRSGPSPTLNLTDAAHQSRPNDTSVASFRCAASDWSSASRHCAS